MVMMIFETISFVNFDFIQERWEMVFLETIPATIDDEENKRNITVTTISAYVDIHFLSVPGLTGYNQGKSSSLYRPPGTRIACGHTYSSTTNMSLKVSLSIFIVCCRLMSMWATICCFLYIQCLVPELGITVARMIGFPHIVVEKR